VISGELEHKDSMGNGRVIKEGEFQYMSAGTGVSHSEFNPSASNPVHLLQIWITPTHPGGEPRYHDFDTKPLRQDNGLALLASPGGDNGSMAIRQHARIHFGHLAQGASLALDDDPGYPHSWLHIIKGKLKAGENTLNPGDGASFEGPLDLTAENDAEFLLFRLV
jgi:redox-sensitive bicupin YhaK (pirin superfamily)